MRTDLLSGDGVNSNHFGGGRGSQLVIVGVLFSGGVGLSR